ncbi:MAG: MBL fold metallo-hydrolase [Leptolyngbya sp. SIO4C1]|nr:MBL fold metallo-hydrolase [Leptolyngbya sp. SIO4C1]
MPFSTTSRFIRQLPQVACHQPVSSQFAVKFWGVRGSVPTPGQATARYGGNTACVEVLIANQRLILDGGTGLRVLGEQLQSQQPVTAHLFFTHTQWDRIQGFPFFLPAFTPGNRFKIYGAIAPNGASIKQRLSDQMLRPSFSVPIQAMQAELEFCNLAAGSLLRIGEVIVETISLNQATQALGYRISWQGRSLVYATDTNPEKIDQNLLYLAQQADVLIYDGTYADATYHAAPTAAPWKIGLALAKAAEVSRVIMFHHSPMQTDSALDELEDCLQQQFDCVMLAREGLSIQL